MNEKTRKDFIDLLSKCSARNRKTTIGAVGGRASADNVNYIKEEIQVIAPDMTPREITLVESRVCSCGKLLTAQNPISGICQHPGCANFTCAQCVKVCSRCGLTFCPHHVSVYGNGNGEVYCRRCRPLKWAKLFFDIGGKEK